MYVPNPQCSPSIELSEKEPRHLAGKPHIAVHLPLSLVSLDTVDVPRIA
jgi:hypothetical protein